MSVAHGRMVSMEIVRTPEARFANLDGYPFEPNYENVPDGEGGTLRVHYVDAGPRDGELILCLHGQPTWSYLYRKMIPIFTDAGYRVLAPDLVGFGRSDKPTKPEDYTYARHVAWLGAWIDALDLRDVTLVAQDWGGLVGLRALTERPERFTRVAIANTGLPDARLPDGTELGPEAAAPMHEAFGRVPVVDLNGLRDLFSGRLERVPGANPFMYWIKFCASCPTFRPADFIETMTASGLSPAVKAGYAAPFPDETYLAGARRFPSLVPIMPDNPAIPDNRKAWKVLERFDKPFLTSWSDDPGVGPPDPFQKRIPGAQNREHPTVVGARHFLQEDKGEEFAANVLRFIADTRSS